MEASRHTTAAKETPRDAANRAVKRVMLAAVHEAGGIDELVDLLDAMDFDGRGAEGKLGPRTVVAWIAGKVKTPAPVAVALAAWFGLSLVPES